MLTQIKIVIFNSFCRTFFALFKWKDFSIIIVQENQNKPITFKSRVNYHFVAKIIEERFLLISLSTKFKGLWLSKTDISSLNSLEEFELQDYYAMKNIEIVLPIKDYLKLDSVKFVLIFIDKI